MKGEVGKELPVAPSEHPESFHDRLDKPVSSNHKVDQFFSVVSREPNAFCHHTSLASCEFGAQPLSQRKGVETPHEGRFHDFLQERELAPQRSMTGPELREDPPEASPGTRNSVGQDLKHLETLRKKRAQDDHGVRDWDVSPLPDVKRNFEGWPPHEHRLVRV